MQCESELHQTRLCLLRMLCCGFCGRCPRSFQTTLWLQSRDSLVNKQSETTWSRLGHGGCRAWPRNGLGNHGVKRLHGNPKFLWNIWRWGDLMIYNISALCIAIFFWPFWPFLSLHSCRVYGSTMNIQLWDIMGRSGMAKQLGTQQ